MVGVAGQMSPNTTNVSSTMQRLTNALTQWRAHMWSAHGLLPSQLWSEHLPVLVEPPLENTSSRLNTLTQWWVQEEQHYID